MSGTESKLARADVSAVSQSCFEARPHSRILGGQARFQELFTSFDFGHETLVHRLTVEKGVCFRHDVECSQLLQDNTARGNTLVVYFLPYRSRKQIALNPTAFAELLAASAAPPSYLEVLANNNGLYNAYNLTDQNGFLKDFHLMVKFPFGPFSNGSLYLRHSVLPRSTVCIITATNALSLVESLVDVLSNSSATKSSQAHPFIPVAVLLERCRISNDDDRHDIDQSVCRIENRSGVSLHNFGSRTRAKIGEYALLQRELHMQDALIVMADHCFSFHTRFAEFLVEEERKFAAAVVGQEQTDYVRASLRLNASMSSWTLEQLHALEKRLKIQLRVIDSTIMATDALTMIRLARASRSDSSTMKAITILTMVFLPATFVCSLFSTGFFDFGQNSNSSSSSSTRGSGIHVVGQFWIFFAVTVPLTIVVLGICAAWLQWSGRRDDDFGETTTAESKRLD